MPLRNIGMASGQMIDAATDMVVTAHATVHAPSGGPVLRDPETGAIYAPTHTVLVEAIGAPPPSSTGPILDAPVMGVRFEDGTERDVPAFSAGDGTFAVLGWKMIAERERTLFLHPDTGELCEVRGEASAVEGAVGTAAAGYPDLPPLVTIEDYASLGGLTASRDATLSLVADGTRATSTGGSIYIQASPDPQPDGGQTFAVLGRHVSGDGHDRFGPRLASGGTGKNLTQRFRAPIRGTHAAAALAAIDGKPELDGKPISLTRAYWSGGSGGTFEALRLVAGKGHCTVMIAFHDGLATSARGGRLGAIMDAHGLVGTLYLPTARLNGAGTLTDAQVVERHADGWGIALGSTTDAKWTDIADPAADWQAGVDYLTALGVAGQGHTHTYHTSGDLGVPDGGHTDALIAAGVETIHDVDPGFEFDRLGPTDMMQRARRSHGVTAATTAAELLAHVDASARRGTAIQIHDHDAMTTAEFETFCAGLEQRQSDGDVFVRHVNTWWSYVKSLAA